MVVRFARYEVLIDEYDKTEKLKSDDVITFDVQAHSKENRTRSTESIIEALRKEYSLPIEKFLLQKVDR